MILQKTGMCKNIENSCTGAKGTVTCNYSLTIQNNDTLTPPLIVDLSIIIIIIILFLEYKTDERNLEVFKIFIQITFRSIKKNKSNNFKPVLHVRLYKAGAINRKVFKTCAHIKFKNYILRKMYEGRHYNAATLKVQTNPKRTINLKSLNLKTCTCVYTVRTMAKRIELQN